MGNECSREVRQGTIRRPHQDRRQRDRSGRREGPRAQHVSDQSPQCRRRSWSSVRRLGPKPARGLARRRRQRRDARLDESWAHLYLLCQEQAKIALRGSQRRLTPPSSHSARQGTASADSADPRAKRRTRADNPSRPTDGQMRRPPAHDRSTGPKRLSPSDALRPRACQARSRNLRRQASDSRGLAQVASEGTRAEPCVRKIAAPSSRAGVRWRRSQHRLRPA